MKLTLTHIHITNQKIQLNLHSQASVSSKVPPFVIKPDSKVGRAWETYVHPLFRRIDKFLQTAPVQLFMICLLMISLFMSEAWICGNAPSSENDRLWGVLMAVFLLFDIETVLLSLVSKGYFGGFFFLMDCLGNISMILDIGWIAQTFMSGGDGNVVGNASVLRATRAAKLGARYGRLMRLMRLLRFLKYLPCFASKEDAQPEPTLSQVRRVSERLSNMLSQRVAGLVLLLVIVVPFLGYSATDHSVDAWVDSIKYLAKNPATSDAQLKGFLVKMQHFFRAKDTPLISVSLTRPGGDPLIYEYKTREYVRDENKVLYSARFSALGALKVDPSSRPYVVNALVDRSFPAQQDAMFGIILMVLVIVLLVGASASFKTSVETLVVVPLEKMTTTLRTSATTMLRSMKAVEKEEEKKAEKNPSGDYDDDDDDLDEQLETEMLDKLVEKLAKIVKTMVPTEEMDIAENVDKATASWLTSSYSQGSARVSTDVKKETDSDRKARMTKLKMAKQVVSENELNSWNLDTLKYSNEDLIEITIYMLQIRNSVDEFNMPLDVLRTFLHEICNRYINTNTYHNFKHGVDVCHTCYRLITIPNLFLVLSPLEIMSILVSGVAHDVGHLGVNNLFLVKAKHHLAILHNDRSPLENMHCAILYELLSKEKFNIFVNLTETQWRDSRKIILAMILGTDMAHHFEQISKTNLFLELNKEDTWAFCSGEKDAIDCFSDEKNRLFIMELILHCSDISNPYKPFAICAAWADLVVEEFGQQGDREKREGLEVSPMMDRNLIVLCNMQMGFIEFVVTPLLNAFVQIFPPLHQIGTNIMLNYTGWGEKRKGEIMVDDKIPNKAEECKKLDERIAKFKERQSFTEALKARPSRGNMDEDGSRPTSARSE